MDDTLYGTRNNKGEWIPNQRTEYPPVFVWPPAPGKALRWFPKYVLPWNLLYLGVAAAVWWVATPSRATMVHLRPGWIIAVLLRNLLITVLWYGLWHWRLYRRRAQESRFKFNPRFPAAQNKRFTLGSQVRENVLWSLASGVPMWTAWEVVTLWLFARGSIPWLQWSQHPIWFVALFFLIPLWREVHFYAIHRLIHWPPLYRTIHSLHHRNTNTAPWSGLSMHPLEHLLYFSAVAIHWIVPSHPVHALYDLVHLGMSPVPGHSGFQRVELGEVGVETGCYMHYLHHKLFEVNYADGVIPLDKWFGSFHDGTPAADARLKARRLARAGRMPEPASE